MAASNREIAVEYLDNEVIHEAGYCLKRIKQALKQTVTTELEFNTFSLIVDPEVQIATLHQDWFACKPEAFDAQTLINLVETARKRNRSKSLRVRYGH